MTVTRESVAQALEEASETGFRTARDVAAQMGLKGSSPLISVVREELEAMAKEGLCEARSHAKAGQMYRSKGAASVSAKVPTAVHRLLALIAGGPLRSYELTGAGVYASTVSSAVKRGLAERTPDGYEITESGRAWLEAKEREFPVLAEARAQMTKPAEEAPGIPEESAEPEGPEQEAPEAPAGDPGREPLQEPQEGPEKEAPGEPEPGPKPELPREANAIITELAEVTVYRIRYRTAAGTGEATFGDPSAVLGDLTDMQWAVGKAIRIREKGGRTEFGHIVDDIWRACL